MLETSVEVILKTQRHYYLEMGMINMSVYSKKSFEYCFYRGLEIFWERDSCNLIHGIPIWQGKRV